VCVDDGQVAGAVTVTGTICVPSVTFTVKVAEPVPGPGPTRVMVITLPFTTAVTELLVEAAL
jgi:hypothetical protein